MISVKPAALTAALFLLAGCQNYVDAQGRTHVVVGPLSAPQMAGQSGPGEAYMPDPVIVEGVHSFNRVYRDQGMAGVQIQVNGCRLSVLRRINADAIPHCYAFDRAAFMVVVSHDRVRHAVPLPNLDVASFDRRLSLYQQALAIPLDLRRQVDDSVFQRVAYVIGVESKSP